MPPGTQVALMLADSTTWLAALTAGVAAVAFYLLRRDMLQTIIFGMLTFTALRLSLG